MFNPFSSIKGTLYAGIALVIIAVGSYLWIGKMMAEKKVLALQIENSRLLADVEVKEIEKNNLKAVIEILEETTKESIEQRAQEETIKKEIDNAPDDQSGPVSPVLRNAIDSVKRLYDN